MNRAVDAVHLAEMERRIQSAEEAASNIEAKFDSLRKQLDEKVTKEDVKMLTSDKITKEDLE